MKLDNFKYMAFLFFFLFVWIGSSAFPAETIAAMEKQLADSSVSGRERILLLTQLSQLTQDSEPTKAVKWSKEALEILRTISDPSLEVHVLLSLTWASQNIGLYESALEYGQKSEKLALEIGDKRATAIASNHISRIYGQLGSLDGALKSALRALKLFEELGDKPNVANSFKNIGNVYREMKNSKLAMTYYLKALQISEDIRDKKGIARALNNIGNIYDKSGQYNKALEYYRKSQDIIMDLKWKKGTIVSLGNIANIYSKTGDLHRAQEYNLKALNISKEMKNKRLTAILLSNIGVVYRLMGQYKKALRYEYNALDIAKKIKNKDIIRNFYEELSYIYDAMKDYKQAFFYLKKYKEIDDIIVTEESRKNISELWLNYKTEKKEKEINWLTQNNRIQQLQLKRQELVRDFLIIVSLLVFIIALVLFNRYRIKQKAEQVLKESEAKLRAINMSKDKLFSIIAHDLGSPLSGLLISSGYLEKNYLAMEGEEVKELLHQIYENSDHMSKLLDNLLQWAVSQLGKLEMITENLDICGMVDDTFRLMRPNAREKNIRLISLIKENTCALADKRMVETILRNLVTNAVKYSNPGEAVHVSSEAHNNFITITVSDTGIGIPTNKLDTLFAPGVHDSTRGTAGEKGLGLGLVLCKEFVEKNEGYIQVERNTMNEISNGTCVIFTLPSASSRQETVSIVRQEATVKKGEQ
jgi:signal transduction histidine kinase/Tfp pilus assembly protein PilF